MELSQRVSNNLQYELFQKLQTVNISSLKRATGVLRHGFIARIC